jgi:catechol 2,3-dioxygenase-like lactoylglutathione lyase family enzyme
VIAIREIDHIVLRVVDLESMIGFYTGALGCKVEVSRDDIGLYQLRAGRSLIDLVPVAGKLGKAGGAAPGKEGRRGRGAFNLYFRPGRQYGRAEGPAAAQSRDRIDCLA